MSPGSWTGCPEPKELRTCGTETADVISSLQGRIQPRSRKAGWYQKN